MARATTSPGSPVQALALPLLMTTACRCARSVSVRLMTTGAAANALVVKTAADAAFSRHSGATASTPISGLPLSFSPATIPEATNPRG